MSAMLDKFGAPAVLIVGFALSACGNAPKPTPAPVCETAAKCLSVDFMVDQGCYVTKRKYILSNNHPSTPIFSSYTKNVRHINSLQPPQSSIEVSKVEPRQYIDLGCERSRGLLDSQWDEWSFAVNAACFSTESCSIASKPGEGNKPPTERPASVDCDQECASGGPWCLNYKLSTATPIERRLRDALSRVTAELLSTAIPKNIDMSNLAKAIEDVSGQKCERGLLTVDANGEVENGGTDCSLGVGLNVPGINLSGLIVKLPGIIRGKYQLGAGQFTSAAKVGEATMTPIIDFYDNRSPPQTFTDTVVAIRGRQGNLTFTTAKTYCARVEFDPG